MYIGRKTNVCYKAYPIPFIGNNRLHFRIVCPRCHDIVYWTKNCNWKPEYHCTLLWKVDCGFAIGSGEEWLDFWDFSAYE